MGAICNWWCSGAVLHDEPLCFKNFIDKQQGMNQFSTIVFCLILPMDLIGPKYL